MLNETGGSGIDKEQAAYGPAWCQNTQCQSHKQVKQNGKLDHEHVEEELQRSLPTESTV